MAKYSSANLFFLIAAAIFIIITPLFILFANGYRWNSALKTLEQTGGIFVESEPKDAIVQILKEESAVKLASANALIDGLFPGQYKVFVTAPKYTTWSKTIAIEPAKVVRLESVFLFPDNLSEKNLTPLNNVSAVALPPDRQSGLAITAADHFYALDLRDGLTTRLETAADAKFIKTDSISWLNDGTESFLALNKNQLRLYAITPTKLSFQVIASNVLSFALRQDKIYFIDSDNLTLYESSLDGATRNPLVKLDLNAKGKLEPIEIYTLAEDKIAMLRQGDFGLINLETGQIQPLIQEVTAIKPNKSSAALFVAHKQGINKISANAAEPLQITELIKRPSRILDLYVVDSESIIFFTEGGKLSYIQTKEPDQPSAPEITLPITNAIFSPNKKVFIGISTGLENKGKIVELKI